MNDRLKQLCEHSKAYATECTKHFTGDEPVVWMDYYTEKFAQLIVQECAAEADRCVERGSLMAAYRIKRHFGIE